jgi:hypothetical protein
MRVSVCRLTFLALGALACVSNASEPRTSFKKLQLTDQFWAEGANVGDFNHDGKVDIVSGPFWYEGPKFKKRHEIYPANASFNRHKPDGSMEVVQGFEGALGTNNTYSECFLTFVYDFNHDGWDDVLVYGFPGKEAAWYENPHGREGHWQRHVILNEVDNESPGFTDITGDGKPEILCCSGGHIGYAEADWLRPAAPWKFHPITPKGSWQRFTHGLGAGDVNGDGRVDILEKDGWWEQPASLENDPVWVKHPFNFGNGGAQMVVYDVNGDGLNDIITGLDAHHFGLAWFEQVRTNGDITFRKHLILNQDGSANAHGVKFSQGHSLFLADIDGDGLKDIITGKRFWAHGPNGDPEPNSAPVLYWFRLIRSPEGVDFVPYLVDNSSGVGTQVIAAPVSHNNRMDIVVGNKRGVFLFENSGR